MNRGRRLALLAGVWVLGVTSSPAHARAQTDRPEVVQLSFEGNEAFPDESLRAAIVTRATSCRNLLFQVLLLCPAGWDAVIDRRFLRPREFRQDVARLELYYIERGYREVRVDTTLVRDESEVDVTFHIDEGTPVRVDSLEILLTEDLPDSSAFRGLPLGEGDPLSAIVMDAARDSVEVRLQNQGYPYADVLLSYFVPSESYTARLTLDIDPGPRSRFGQIDVEGNALLEEESIRRMLPFRSGNRFSRDLLIEGQRNLYTLDIMRSAVVQARPDEAARDTLIPVTVRVNEGTLHRVRTALGWTTADCLTTEARWASRNFQGGARRLEARLRLSNLLASQVGETACPAAGTGTFARLNGQAAVELTQPWIFSPRNALTAGAYVERQSLPGIFVREAVGLNLSLRRTIGRASALTLSYQPQLARLEAAEVFFCASFLACLPSDIRIFQSANLLAPIGLGVSRDRRNSLLNPTRGYQAVLDLEHAAAWTGSDFAYNRATAELARYLEVGDGVLAARLRSGIVGGGRFLQLGGGAEAVVHPQKRFYAGGANSVRGFPENRLGPRVLTVDVADLLGVPDEDVEEPACRPEEIVPLGCDPSAVPDGRFSPRAVGGSVVIEGNLEGRFPVGLRDFQGAAFVDWGQVWSEPSDVDLEEIEVSPGVGLRFFSPIGPVRLDLAYRFRGGESLFVATSGIREYVEGEDDPEERIDVRQAGGGTTPIPWVRTDDLTFLLRQAPFGADTSFLSRIQLHISIGQAF